MLLLLTNFEEYHWYKVNSGNPVYIFNTQSVGLWYFEYMVSSRVISPFFNTNITYLLVLMQLHLNPSFKGNQ